MVGGQPDTLHSGPEHGCLDPNKVFVPTWINAGVEGLKGAFNTAGGNAKCGAGIGIGDGRGGAKGFMAGSGGGIPGGMGGPIIVSGQWHQHPHGCGGGQPNPDNIPADWPCNDRVTRRCWSARNMPVRGALCLGRAESFRAATQPKAATSVASPAVANSSVARAGLHSLEQKSAQVEAPLIEH